MFRLRSCLCIAAAVLLINTSAGDVIDGEELTDPTRPIRLTDVSDDTFVEDLIRNVVPASYDLSFVRAGGDTPIAVINQQQVGLGDVIGGAEVIAIDRGGVTLRVNNAERRINLYGVNVKTNAVSQ